ncbi:MAG: MaoC family dehydratase [Clostridiales bacterium]|jgi:3-hydroxybutyryl-CoA dehydratase|nr:MaoC family dehydratase [Clostridiales bacterium]
MNSFSFEDLRLGLTESFEVMVTAQMMEDFLRISGDCNPIHLSDGYARSKGFSDRVVYGLLVSAFYSTLVGVYLPGEHCVLQEISVNFKKPVYIGDRLTVTGTVVETHDVLRRVSIKAKIRNQNGKAVSTANITVGVMSSAELS